VDKTKISGDLLSLMHRHDVTHTDFIPESLFKGEPGVTVNIAFTFILLLIEFLPFEVFEKFPDHGEQNDND
jgi:hypothetical protein